MRLASTGVGEAHLAGRLRERLSEGDADILDGMVLVNMRVAACLKFQAEAPLDGERFEHMREQADRRAHLVGFRGGVEA